ncbi:unnamed protein product, partial [Rotaria sp. Silwood2]
HQKEMTSTGAIERKALGRHGIIGSLYDIRTDTLEGGNLFNKELPESFIRLQDSANVSYHIDFNNSQKETFNNMNIEASLKLSLLGGLIDVTGSAKYLKQTKTNSHTVRVTFMYKAKTKQEHLLINTADLYKYFSLDALENPNATHVVIGILWGANVAATFERVVENREAVEQLEGQLSVVLKSIAGSIEGNAKVNCGDINKAAFESLTVSFSGDVLIKDCPQTIDAVMKTYVNIPDLIKPLNGGKGRQLEFVLYPLKRIAQMFKFELKVERLIKEVSEHLVFRIENIFEQISMTTRKFNDFLDVIKPWEQYIPKDWLKVIKEKKATHAGDELKTQRQMASLLQKIRSGTTEESKMEELIDKFDLENPGNPANYCDYAFSTIDIDKSGKISFVEFMNAVALTQPGDLKTRLGLVFSVCDYNNAQTIDDGKIVKFLEVIAELEHGEGAVNTNAAKSVARAIMELCGKSKDGAVKKEEFIDW